MSLRRCNVDDKFADSACVALAGVWVDGGEGGVAVDERCGSTKRGSVFDEENMCARPRPDGRADVAAAAGDGGWVGWPVREQ